MNVLVLGATGFTGKEVLQLLLDNGHIVTAVTRSAQSLSKRHPNLIVKEGSVLNPLFIHDVLADQDAVINCLGVGGKGTGKPNTLLSDSARILVSAMEEKSIVRLIAMSNIGAGDSKQYHPFVFRKIILPYFMKWLKVIIDDKNIMEPLITQSDLNWTIVRCPNITEKAAKGKVHSTLDGEGLKLSITNKDAATFIVNQLTSDLFLKKTPSISN